MELRYKKLTPEALVPSRATEGSVGYDLFVPEDFEVRAMSRTVIPTGIAIEVPRGYMAQICGRSGNSLKGIEGIAVGADRGTVRRFNADVMLGIIDGDYRGNVGVIIKNCDSGFILERGTKIAQMILTKIATPELVETDVLSATDRGGGGFGSTGSK